MAPLTPTANPGVEITVHWLERSRAQRLLWLLEECNLEYKIHPYQRVGGKAPPEMKAVHPLGKSPILTITVPGQTDPLVLAESGAIFEYVVDHFAPYLAPGRWKDGQEGQVGGETEAWLRYRYYMHYGEGSLMSLLMRMHDLHGLTGVESAMSNLKRNLETHLTFLESQMVSAPDHGPFLCGEDFTAADIMMCFPLLVVQSSMGRLTEYPGLEAYVERMISRPAYGESVKRAEDASGERYSVV